MHAIAGSGTKLDGLPEASALQTSELASGLEAGLGVGGVAGLLGGLVAVTFPPAGLVLGGGAVLATTLAGAGLGALVSGLVAKDVPNHELAEYERKIAMGQVLLLVDVPRGLVNRFSELIRDHLPEAEITVSEPKERSKEHRDQAL